MLIPRENRLQVWFAVGQLEPGWSGDFYLYALARMEIYFLARSEDFSRIIRCTKWKFCKKYCLLYYHTHFCHARKQTMCVSGDGDDVAYVWKVTDGKVLYHTYAALGLHRSGKTEAINTRLRLLLPFFFFSGWTCCPTVRHYTFRYSKNWRDIQTQ